MTDRDNLEIILIFINFCGNLFSFQESSKEQHLIGIYIFRIINALDFTFDQYNASLQSNVLILKYI